MHHYLFLLGLAASAASPPSKVLSFELTKRPHSSGTVPRTRHLKRDNSYEDTLNNQGGWYTIDLAFGSEKVSYTALVDTGSADLWVSSHVFDPTQSSTFTNLTTDFSVCYASGECDTGYFGKDTVTVGDQSLDQIQFGVSVRDTDNALLGLGYKQTEYSTTWDSNHNPQSIYDNFPYALKGNGLIETAAYSIWLNSPSESTGNIIFGGIDTSKYKGSLQTVPSVIYEINRNGENFLPNYPTDITAVVSGVGYLTSDGNTVDVITNAGLGGLLDSGTTTASLPKDWVIALGAGVGAVWDDNINGMAATEIITEGSILFDFSGIKIELPLSDAWELAYQNGELYKIDGKQAYWLGIVGDDSDSHVILGDKLLRHAYVAIDLENQEIGLAQAETSPGGSNLVAIGTDGIPSATQAPNYSSSTLFSGYSVTTPSLIGTPTAPSS